MAERTETKGEASQQRIIDAAYALFLEQGYHGTSMRQIADRAGLTVGGIYNHFDGKESIWVAVFTTRHPYRTMLPLMLSAEGESVAGYLRTAANSIVAALQDNNDLFNLMFIEMVEFSGSHLPTIYHSAVPYFLPLAERFRRLAGRLHPLPLPILARTFAGLLFSYYVTERLMPDEMRPSMGDAALEAFIDIYLYGILDEPRPGR